MAVDDVSARPEGMTGPHVRRVSSSSRPETRSSISSDERRPTRRGAPGKRHVAGCSSRARRVSAHVVVPNSWGDVGILKIVVPRLSAAFAAIYKMMQTQARTLSCPSSDPVRHSRGAAQHHTRAARAISGATSASWSTWHTWLQTAPPWRVSGRCSISPQTQTKGRWRISTAPVEVL